MARTANRRMTAEKKQGQHHRRNGFKTAIYTRISRDKKEKSSDSIENQIILCENYIRKNEGHHIVEVYKDIAKTGTEFDRPGFENLMDKVRKGEVNCIIVKDLSRFGRNYTELGNYIEKIFPFLNVRFIAVDDDLDTFHMEDLNKSLEVILKNIVNETYAKDISKKISTSHQARIKQGGFICGIAPYGYFATKDEDGIRRLYMDTQTAPIVKEIFQDYLKGWSSSEIVKKLFEQRICSVMDYRKYGKAIAEKGDPVKVWNPATVLKVLKNPVYTGTLIQGKNQQHLYEDKKREQVREEYWTITENAHEAIIPMDMFEKAQELIAMKRSDSKSDNETKHPHVQHDTIFRKKVFCSTCQKTMITSRRSGTKKTTYHFNCNKLGEYIPQRCGTSISENVLKVAVKEDFDNIVSKDKKSYQAYLEGYKKFQKEKSRQKNKEIQNIEKQLLSINRSQSDSYEKYVLGEWSLERFEEEKQCLSHQREQWDRLKNKKLLAFEEEKHKIQEKHKYLQAIFHRKGKSWDQDFVETIIDKIFVGKDNKIEIKFRFEETPVIVEKQRKKAKTEARKESSI